MDIFIDKLAQKITGSEIINANTTAEAKELEMLKTKVEGYDNLLQEMRELNLKNTQSAERLNGIIERMPDTAEIINSIMAKMPNTDEMVSSIMEKMPDAEKMVSSIVEKIPEPAKMPEIEIPDNREQFDEMFDKTSDLVHRENVKVYRNVQAAVRAELENQTKSLMEAQKSEENKKELVFLKVMSVLIFIAVIADITLRVLGILGII